ncbi:MAG: transposase [Chloroflexota bacterium]|nr:transposase [Chloroflexota bacterium]
MPLPAPIIAVLSNFAPLFTAPTWRKVVLLLLGTLLAHGPRTVTVALRLMGYARDPRFSRLHQVLNRARWSPLAVSHRLLLALLARLVPSTARLTFVIDEHLERRWGPQITKRGHYRDPARSSKARAVASSGLRWICVTLLVPLTWADRPWALPFLTILTTPPAQDKAAGRRHKTTGAWAQQVVRLLRHWLPNRELCLLGDTAYASLDLAAVCQAQQVVLITPFHLDAALYTPAPPRAQQTSRKPRRIGTRLPNLDTVAADPTTVWTAGTLRWYHAGERLMEWVSGEAVWYRGGKCPVPLRWVRVRTVGEPATVRAYLCTDATWTVAAIVTTYMGRWSIEVTFAEARRHLGVETQRQWSDKAIARSTPALLGLFSLVVLCGHALHPDGAIPVERTAWYHKEQATFSDVLRTVRRHLWGADEILQGGDQAGCKLIHHSTLARLLDAVVA